MLMSTIRDLGITVADPMDDLLAFDKTFNHLLSPMAFSDTDDLMVGSIADHTPAYGYMDPFYFNPYADWINVVLMPALMWASVMAVAGGPWETIIYTYRNGFSTDTVSSYSSYVLMQLKAIFWGPLQIIYYTMRAGVFIILLPYNTFIFILNLLFIPAALVSWFFYFLKAWLWWLDALYILSKYWINDPLGFITTFFYLCSDSYLIGDIIFFWVWIPLYWLGSVGQWLFDDTFETRPTLSSLYSAYTG